jgi:hypothetical protein
MSVRRRYGTKERFAEEEHSTVIVTLKGISNNPRKYKTGLN